MATAFTHDNPWSVTIQIRNNISEIVERRVVPINLRYIAKKGTVGDWHIEIVDLDSTLTSLIPLKDIVKWGTDA